MDHRLSIFISKEEIQSIVENLASQIQKDFPPDEPIILVGLLRGCIFFLSDLARALKLQTSIDFMIVSSYDGGLESTRNVKVLQDLAENIEGYSVLLVEDIVDTGYTLVKVLDFLRTKNPKILKICTLLDKPSRREIDINLDYIGKVIDNNFIVGYGMDFDRKYRNLPDIYTIHFE